MSSDVYIIGDIHGQYDKMVKLLAGAGLVDVELKWSGGQATLWFMGDFCDRGPNLRGVLDLIMRLQEEAPRAGGRVEALLGNHEVVILSALWMGDAPTTGPSGTFYGDWIVNGGVESDLDVLEDKHIEWMLSLPALARVGDWLLMHANSMIYLKYGSSIEEVNLRFRELLSRKDPFEWNLILSEFIRDFGPGIAGTTEMVDLVLRTFDVKRLVHGHSPISGATKKDPLHVTEALIYEGGKCVNVDAGMYMGSPGFVFKLAEGVR